jgi:DNA polymerase (family 10)
VTSNRDVARVLREIAAILEIKGENSFRIRSYRLAADSVESHGQEVAEMLRRGEDLRAIDGVGEGIAKKLAEIVASGDCAYRRELLQEVPAGLLPLLEVPGLGPKGVALVWRRLGVTSGDELLVAIQDGRFRTLPGMKDKKEARIRKGLEDRLRAVRRFLLPVAAEAVRAFDAHLRSAGAARVEAAGSFRRGRETVGDLDLIAVGGDAERVASAFAAHPEVREVLAQGSAKSSVVLATGLQVDLRHVEPDSLGAALQYFTGNKAHNVALRERALKRGLKLNEYGVYRVDDGARVAGATEQEVYAALGLAFVAPEMREDRGEIQAAEAGTLPRLVELGDIQGDLHSHTTESDGRDSLEDMAEAARKAGRRYLAITDHSRAIPSPTNRTGMDEARCLAHIRRIRSLQKRVPELRLLAGIEVDILPDGRLDMAEDVLAQLDVVVASLHSRLGMERPAQTERLLRAFASPHCHIWGHPLARLVGKRDAVEADLDVVFAEAGRRGVALEINSYPDRLDLPDHLMRAAREKGVRFVVSTDSHAVGHLAYMHWGVAQARRGWLTRDDVLNTRKVADLLAARRKPVVPA